MRIVSVLLLLLAGCDYALPAPQPTARRPQPAAPRPVNPEPPVVPAPPRPPEPAPIDRVARAREQVADANSLKEFDHYYRNAPDLELDRNEIARLRRAWYIRTHPSLPDPIKAAIEKGTVARGMTTEQVSASMGEPRRQNTSGGSWGHLEQWYYRWGGDSVYLYFENRALTSWQIETDNRWPSH